jgi:hypothetical protein
MREPKHIPGVERTAWRRLMRQKWLVESISSVPPLLVASIGAYRLVQDTATQSIGYWSAFAAVWLLLASFVKVANAREVDHEADSKLDHDGLKAAMFVLHAGAGQVCGLNPANIDDLRVTFHRVVEPINNPKEIEQLVPYAGGGGGGAGRRFSVRSGITGRCIRTKQLYTMHRPDDNAEAYRAALGADWGYTQVEANQISIDKLSCMAVPVLDSSGKFALGVIYLDSKQPSLFESTEVQTAILESCAGVARYVTERYGK